MLHFRKTSVGLVNSVSSMKCRRLGRTSLSVSEIGYGAWGIGGTQWKGGSDEESLRTLRRAFDLGVNFVDTALAYADGHSEELTGRAIREFGGGIAVATKVPPRNRVWPARADSTLDEVFPAEYMIRSTEESLRNLGLERIDLQQLHVWNAKWTQQEEWRRVVNLVDDLKIRNEELPAIALRFCLSRPAVTCVIPGMHRVRHAESNIRAAEHGSLPPDVLAILERHRWARNFYQ